MELTVRHDLIKFLHALGLHVDHIVDLSAIIYMPQVYSEVISG